MVRTKSAALKQETPEIHPVTASTSGSVSGESSARGSKGAGSRTGLPSARERLLTAANELFYAEGVHTVGIDRVIERAGVAKASLYSTFGSKDELVRAYLKGRADARQKRITERLTRHASPRDKITAVFDLLGEIASDPGFRGCAFINATAEGRRDENKLIQVCADSRGWMRSLFTDLARECGAQNAPRLGRQLAILYDGAITASSMECSAEPAREAKSMAELILDTQVQTRARKSRA